MTEQQTSQAPQPAPPTHPSLKDRGCLLPRSLEEATKMGKLVAGSGLVGRWENAQQLDQLGARCTVRIMRGLEVGIPPMEAVGIADPSRKPANGVVPVVTTYEKRREADRVATELLERIALLIPAARASAEDFVMRHLEDVPELIRCRARVEQRIAEQKTAGPAPTSPAASVGGGNDGGDEDGFNPDADQEGPE